MTLAPEAPGTPPARSVAVPPAARRQRRWAVGLLLVSGLLLLYSWWVLG